MNEFGSLLRQYRRNTTDPDEGGALTQTRLAALVSAESGQIIRPQQISYWETGRRPFPAENRELLLALIKVLVACGGMTPLPEADQLLESLGLRVLNPTEVAAIIGQPPSPPSETAIAELIARVDKLIGWSSADDHARTSWEGRVVHSFATLTSRFSWQNSVKLAILFVAIWLAITQVVPALRLAELGDAETRLAVAIRYTISLLAIPFLLAIVIPTPRNVPFEVVDSADKRNLFLMRLTGSYVGFTVMLVLLFLVGIVDMVIRPIVFPYWFYVLLLVVPFFFAYVMARRTPANRYKLLGAKPLLHEIDTLMLFAIPLLVMGTAFLLYAYYDYFNNGWMIVGLIILLLVMMYWEQEGKRKNVSKQLLLLTGMSLALVFFVGVVAYVLVGRETGQWTISSAEAGQLLSLMLILAGMLIVFATSMLWHSPKISIRGFLVFGGMVAAPFVGLAYSPFTIPTRLALLGVVLLVWIGWGRRRIRAYWWIPPALSLGYIAMLAALILLLLDTFPPLLITVGYIVVISGLIYRAYRTSEKVQNETGAA